MFLGEDLYCDYCKGNIPLHWRRRVLTDGRVMCQECMGVEDPDRPRDHGARCACGYNLTGLRENTCPECGKAFEPPRPDGHQAAVKVARPIAGELRPPGPLKPTWVWRCGLCGAQLTYRDSKVNGSFVGECIIWAVCLAVTVCTGGLLFPSLFAALGYSLYRLVSRTPCCAACQSPNIGQFRVMLPPEPPGWMGRSARRAGSFIRKSFSGG